MKVQVHIDTTAKALDKRDRSRVHSIPCSATCDGLIDVILRDGTADNRMHLRRQVLRSRHPVAQGDGHRDDPLPRGDPGDDLLDEMCRHLRHAPPGTRRTKPASLATEGHQESRGGRCHSPGAESHGQESHTADSHKIRVGHRSASPWHQDQPRTRRERSPGAPRSRGRAPCRWDPGVCRWQRLAPYEPPQTAGREWKCQELPSNILLKCSVYKQKVDQGMRRKHAGRIPLPCGGGKKCV